MTFIIPEFAKSYKMNVQDAYRYLKKYGGMDYLNKCWWALHTDNPFWAVRDMFEVCKNNGGMCDEITQLYEKSGQEIYEGLKKELEKF